MSARLALMLLCCGQAAAALEPSPGELLERAKRNRTEFYRAISEVERLAPSLPTRERLFPYLDTLEPLAEIGRGYELETLGADPVKDLGDTLTASAAKWVRLDRESPAFIRNFLKWASNGTRAMVAGESPMLISGREDPAALLAWNRGIAAAIDDLREFHAHPSVILSYEELQGIFARSLLARRYQFSLDQIRTAVEQTRSAAGIQELLIFLDLETDSPSEASDREQLVDWAALVAENSRKLGPASPLRYRADAGALVLELMVRSLYEGDAPDPRRISRLLECLTPSQIADLTVQLASLYAERPIPRKQAGYLRALVSELRTRFPAVTAPNRRRAFEMLRTRLNGH